MRQRMVSWRIFTRSGPGHHWVPVLSRALKLLQMVRNIIIQRDSTGFRSRWVWGPVSGWISIILQELLELPPYYRHIRPAIVMHQVEPRTHCTIVWSDIRPRISSGYLMAVRVSRLLRSVCLSMDMSLRGWENCIDLSFCQGEPGGQYVDLDPSADSITDSSHRILTETLLWKTRVSDDTGKECVARWSRVWRFWNRGREWLDGTQGNVG